MYCSMYTYCKCTMFIYCTIIIYCTMFIYFTMFTYKLYNVYLQAVQCFLSAGVIAHFPSLLHTSSGPRCVARLKYKIVNLNSKYKEDDYTDSNASVNSLDVCVHRIHFRNEASTPHMSNPRSSQLPVFSQVMRVELVTAPTQGAS